MPTGKRPRVEDLITLGQAAEIAGYAQRSSLLQAIQRDRLKAIRKGNWFTTREWLQEYLDQRPPNPWYEERRAQRLRREDAEKGQQA